MSYRVISFRLPRALEEIAGALLWEAGTLGLETRDESDDRVKVEAWFGGDLPAGDDPLAGWTAEGVERLGARTVEEADWLAAYREKARPFALGDRFWVDPREPDAGSEAPAGRRLLRLPARTAFGIGSHESTRLAVELLEETEIAGRRVLDVGTGTGILAFVALALGAADTVAFDVDFGAVSQARANAAVNGLAPRLFTGVTESVRPLPRFDLAVVNIIPQVIVPEMPGIARLLGDGVGGGEMILSGILVERGEWTLVGAAAAGFVEQARRQTGDWVAFRVARPPVGRQR
ncbi:MAG TPA: 50S ribosomal protein L11 methyltransferase [Thermoanaerobaculia bacterium]|nr:50S ribosomal protein L11 methyltransferase [Thermoanaerobaculia bacterium]